MRKALTIAAFALLITLNGAAWQMHRMISAVGDALDAYAQSLMEVERSLMELERRVQQLEQTMADFQVLLPYLPEVERISQAIQRFGGATQVEAWAAAWQVLESARRYNLDPAWLVALGAAESNWNLHARGRVGELGPLQVRPETCWYVGADCSGPLQQIEAGARYLALLLRRCEGRLELAIARYNVGHNAKASTALRKGRRYVRRVAAILREVKSQERLAAVARGGAGG